MKRLTLLTLLLVLIAGASAPADAQAPWWTVLAPSRATSSWTNAGVPGGIPSGSWSQCGSTIAAYGSASAPADPGTINNAIAACPANTYVLLGAGNFYLSGGLIVNQRSNVEIRGMGANTTFIYFYGTNNCQGVNSVICFQGSLNWVGSNGNGTGFQNGPVTWSAGFSQGTSVITIASVPNLVIGNPIILEQSSTANDVGAVLEQDATTGGNPFTSPGNAGPYSGQGGAIVVGKDQAHVYTVIGCNGSTTVGTACSGTNVAVTIDPPLEETNWSPSLNPFAWWATNPERMVGVQNLSIDGANTGWSVGAGYMITFFDAIDGWVQGVRSTNTSRAHVEENYAARITVRNNYFFLSRFSTQTSYGWECFLSSDSLVENNIFQAIAGPLTFNEGCVGHVLSYNFGINGYYTQSANFLIPWSNQHAANNDFNLYEGNVASMFDGDIIHGSHNQVTLFRNRFNGTNPACYVSGSDNSTYAGYLASTFGTCQNNLVALIIYANNRIYNVVGNVVGTTGVQNVYKSSSEPGGGSNPVFSIGSGDNHNGAVVPSDPAVAQTLLLWGNCDAVNGFNAANCQFNSSDVPVTANLATAQQPYANTVPTNHTLPASFYYSTQPSWWPSGKPWPIIGPDVTGGNIAGTGGLAYTNPAEDCYNSLAGSTSTGTGGPFPFDASVCYGSGLTGAPPPAPPPAPAPPTNLSATVN